MRIRADLLHVRGKCGIGGVANRGDRSGFGLMRNEVQQKLRIRGELASGFIIARGGRGFGGKWAEVVDKKGAIL